VIYAKATESLLSHGVSVKAMAHITGGGLIENPVRVLPDGVKMVLDASKWEIHTIFHLLKQWGNVDIEEMFRTFNMGIGMVIVVPASEVKTALEVLESSGFPSRHIGSIDRGDKKEVQIEWSCCV
jgi:phosphoribosylformylglycinamidine cyclo-ligase